MGYGDELMASGMAKGLARKGQRAAFGDGRRIVWSQQAREVFKDNPNVAAPGSERERGLVWIPHFRGHRLYGEAGTNRWVWNNKFRPIPGEVFLTDEERRWAERNGSGFVIIEPNVKSTAPNKQWPFERYQIVVNELCRDYPTLRLVQILYSTASRKLVGVEYLSSPSFRHALALIERARLFIGPEGGLHHGAAAFNRPAVVIFGGYIHPRTTGYSTHVNLFDPAGGPACGVSVKVCSHCRRVMQSISTEMVRQGITLLLREASDVSSTRFLSA